MANIIPTTTTFTLTPSGGAMDSFVEVEEPEVPTPLALAAAALGENEYVSWTAVPYMYMYGTGSPVNNGLVYHSIQHRDPVRRQVHFLYKPHTGDVEDGFNDVGAFRHYIYDEVTDSFTQVWMNGVPNKNFRDRTGALIRAPSAHIYGNSAIDPATGDLYYAIYGRKYLSKYTAATGAWGHLPSTISGAITSPANGLVWHPHLFGDNDGGCVFAQGNTTALLYGWRKSDDSWTSIATTPRTSARTTGVGTYFAAINAVLIGSTDERTELSRAPLMRIDPGDPPTSTVLSVPPVNCASTGGFDQAPCGYLMQHPNNPAKVLLIERAITLGAGNRTWTSTDGDTWTQGVDHQFPATSENIVMCSIPEYRVVWYVTQTTEGGITASVLWKPPA